MKTQGVMLSAHYNFLDFYNDCKNHREKIIIETDAKTDAMNLLHLFGEETLENQILDYIVNYNPDLYEFINTEPYRNGTESDRKYHPLVDSYLLPLVYFDLYIAFCIQKTGTGWIIKSIHSDNSHKGTGDTISLGSYIELTRKLI